MENEKREYKVYLLITDSNKENIVVKKENGKISLPSIMVKSDWWWSPAFTNDIAKLGSQETGISQHYLREVFDHNEECLCEMEMLNDDKKMLTNYSWKEINDIKNIHLENDLIKSKVIEWEKDIFSIKPLRPVWELYGWYEKIVNMIKEILVTYNYELSGEIEKIKSFCAGSILVIPVQNGEKLYFKVSLKKGINEATAITNLALQFPDNVPEILTANLEESWMIMKEFKAGYVSDIKDMDMQKKKASEVLSKFAKVQIELSKDIEKWKKFDATLNDNTRLYEDYKSIVEDRDLLNSGKNPMSEADILLLNDFLPELKNMLNKLSEYNIPYSIMHEDFREGNLAIDGDKIIFYDWADAVITHPFFSLIRYIDYMERPDSVLIYDHKYDNKNDDYRKLVRDSYLVKFEVFENPERLKEAFILTRNLNYIYLVTRWYRYSFTSEISVDYRGLVRDALSSVLQLIRYLKGEKIKTIELKEKELKKFCGKYWCEAAKLERKIFFEDSKLYYWRNKHSKSLLMPISKTKFVMNVEVENNVEFEFVDEKWQFIFDVKGGDPTNSLFMEKIKEK